MRGARLAAPIAAAATLAGCSLAPPYSPPAVSTPVTYKEMGSWTPASPADTSPRGAWWSVFDDDALDGLERRLDAGNPDLAGALARYDEARALAAQARSALVPQLDATAYATRNRLSQDKPLTVGGPYYFNDAVLGGTVSYEFDLWGRVRNRVASGKAEAQASGEDAASIRLSLEAELAADYFGLRGLDAQTKLLDDTVDAYARALSLTQAQHAGGSVSGLNVARAQAQLEAARAQRTDVAAQRALLEHAIASLVGEPASSFSLAPDARLTPPPMTPVTAPAVLLQRRPDIAAAERRAFAANARIGVAKAAYFPAITLDATGGFETAGNVDLLNLANSYWTLGPAAAMTLFDGGARKAGVQAARAQFDEASQAYRSTVLAAFQQVEDSLALCNKLAQEADQQAAAVDAAARAQALSMIQYRLGAVTYLDVVVAQTADLEARQAALTIATRRLKASVDLVRDLGGGWAG